MDYTITIDLKRKTAKVSKVIAFRERAVPVLAVNIGSATPSNLRLRLMKDSILCAEISAFSASGANASGNLNLNTTQIEDVFDGRMDQSTAIFTLALTDRHDNTLLINQAIEIMNNPDSDDLSPASSVVSAYFTGIKGSDTIAVILAKSDAAIGDMWICTDTDPAASVPGTAGDGYVWDGVSWVNVGAIRGPQATEVQFQYSADGVSWGAYAPGCMYFRTSTDGGLTWSAARQFFGSVEWNAAQTYGLNEFCSRGGVLYKSLSTGNLNHAPESSPTWWSAYTSGGGGDEASSMMFGWMCK